MRYGIFSDIHSNIEALGAVIKALEIENIDVYICGGDIVGYGAEPSRSIEIVRKLTDKVVCGNHDWGSVGLFDISTLNPLAKEAVLWTANRLKTSDKAYLKTLKAVYEDKNITVVHGSLNDPEQFYYISSISESFATFELMKKRVCFIGHTHSTVVFVKTGEEIAFSIGSKIMIEEDSSYIVNVGSAGQPRDGNPRACYAVFDTGENYVEIKRVPYDIKKSQEKILAAGLPPVLADRLSEGR